MVSGSSSGAELAGIFHVFHLAGWRAALGGDTDRTMGDSDDRAHFRPPMGRRPRARERVAEGSLRVGVSVRQGHGRRWSGKRRGAGVAPAAEGLGPRHTTPGA
jgi:hypothetical protein